MSLPIGVIFLFFCTAVIYDISLLFVNKLPISKQRRGFFKKSLDISSLALASAVSVKAIYEATFLEHEVVEVKLKNLQKTYTIAQISDIHIGGLIDANFIKK